MLFEREEVFQQEEVGVGWGGFLAEERGGTVQRKSGLVDNLVGEVVEDGGLVGN